MTHSMASSCSLSTLLSKYPFMCFTALDPYTCRCTTTSDYDLSIIVFQKVDA